MPHVNMTRTKIRYHFVNEEKKLKNEYSHHCSVTKICERDLHGILWKLGDKTGTI